MKRLTVLPPAALSRARRRAVDPETLAIVRPIVEDVRARGEAALREHAERFGDVRPGEPLFLARDELVVEPVDPRVLALLDRTRERIRAFALAQLGSIRSVEVPVPGGVARQLIAPVEAAGAYAPGGRFPLPSSVLMTVVTARAAGVERVWLASPRPTEVTRLAAHLAGADGLLAAGGAQAIAALAFGAGPMGPADVVVGPGNRFVTAAKQCVAGEVRIDMLAGPSELVVVADGSADPDTVAADLLAQAEHDPDAVPILISTDASLLAKVEAALEVQLADLPTRATAEAALRNGAAVVVGTIAEAIACADRLAPEHLQLVTHERPEVAPRHFGALFLGEAGAEVLGDYGAGPNHTLPTGGGARSVGGLSVFDFLRIRTELELHDLDGAEALVQDAVALARLEGLEAHARAATRRR